MYMAMSLAGTNRTVEKLTVNDVKNFYTDNYIPNNAAISYCWGFFISGEMKAIH